MAGWEEWEGHDVVDQGGTKIGKIADIYYDNDTSAPEWARVRTGLFGMRETFIPLQTAEPSGDVVRVPYEKDFVKDAPNVDADFELTEEDEARLAQFYGLSYSDTRSTSGPLEGQTARTATGTDYEAREQTARGRHDDAMTRSEEEMRVAKARRPSELVRLRKQVVTEPKQVTVPVQREEVRVEREPITDENVDKAMSGPDLRESEHEVTLHEEEVKVEKQVVPKERVRLDKDVSTEERQVTGEVRKEQIEVEREGGSSER
jgi:uncharacterized protein (TIGR02271 family)